jgi:hypothetical protein
MMEGDKQPWWVHALLAPPYLLMYVIAAAGIAFLLILLAMVILRACERLDGA